jgi:glycine/D-amino acid oxidase-like deaminating enzyme
MTMAPTTVPAHGTEEIQDAGHVDVLIVGAGVSGIGAAHHLRDQCGSDVGRPADPSPRLSRPPGTGQAARSSM